MTTLPKRRWFVRFVIETSLTPPSMRRDAARWREVAVRGGLPRYWTFRGASRVASRRNRHLTWATPGIFEVFGPLGKGEE